MENQGTGFAVTLILMAMLCTVATSQSDCNSMIISMSPCLNYITANSSSPLPGCCTQLGSVVKSRPECLCQVLNGGGSSLGLDVNQTLVQALPATCNVKTPPISSCNATSPNGAPTGNPGSPSEEAPSAPGNGSSDTSSNKLAVPLFFLLFAASYASTIAM